MAKDDSEVLAKLETIIAILQLAFREQIERARKEILSDAIAAAVLELSAGEGMEAGELQRRVAETTKQSIRSIQRRVATLVSQRAIEQIGSGPRIRYRNTNLI